MKRLAVIIALIAVAAAAPVQARTFADFHTDAAAAPYRAVAALAAWHPLADASAALRRAVSLWDERFMQLSDLVAIGAGRVVLGTEAVRDSADRLAAAVVSRLVNAAPLPPASATAAIGAAAAREPAPPADDGSGLRWTEEVERFFH